MSRPVPVCHRTIGPAQHVPDNDRTTDYDAVPDPRPCIGSRCALWLASDTFPGGLCADAAVMRPEATVLLWSDPAQEGGDS